MSTRVRVVLLVTSVAVAFIASVVVVASTTSSGDRVGGLSGLALAWSVAAALVAALSLAPR